jgi:preprotein translocase YajC subunit
VTVIRGEPAGKRTVNRKDAPMLGINELAAATTTKSGFNPSSLLLILVVVVAFYLLMIRPQQRRKQQAQQKQSTVAPGARVRTTAGMYATVVDVDGDDLILEIAPGVEVRYMKKAVMDVVSSPEADDAPADEADGDYFDADHADDADHVADVDAADDTAPATAAANGSTAEADSEETAYEQATGSKKD